MDKVGRNLHLQRHHPINIIKNRIETHFTNTFKQANGRPLFQTFDNFPPVVSIQQNFDDLLIPADHISRRPTDTFYTGHSTLLRTHTSAHQTHLMRSGVEAFLVTADCYRRDEIDASHYPVFHQMEGVRIFPPGTDAKEVELDLKRTVEGVARSLLGDVQCRWVDAYFPFTHPSFELEAHFQGNWLEVLGSGVVHQDIMQACGLGDRHGWAFGMGIERLAMVLFQIPDIRLFWSRDSRFLDQFREGQLHKFLPFSKYPHVFKDISFWYDPASFHENDLYDMVRSIAGDVVERVAIVDEFVHPKNKRTSRCYRITYRSMERTLTNEEIDQLQEKIRDNVRARPGIELR